MPKKIFSSYNNLAKKLNLKPQILTGGLILTLLLVITLVSLQNLNQDTEQRSQALGKTCGWCSGSCILKDEKTICLAVEPPQNCNCVADTNGGCMTVGSGCLNKTTPAPTATETPEPTITNSPTPTATNTPAPSNTPVPTNTLAPSPTVNPTIAVCPQADIASAITFSQDGSPRGYNPGEPHDCCVDSYDLNFLRLSFQNQNPKADINKDQKINLWDYTNLVSTWHQGCN